MFSKTEELTLLDKNSNEMPSLDDRIVISGVAGLFPSCHNVKDLNNILYKKINPIKQNTFWKNNHPEVAQFTGHVPGLQDFDAQFFNINYQLCCNMDVLARKILEQAYAAIYDAGVSPGQLSGKKVGVYMGTCLSEARNVYSADSNSLSGLQIAGGSKAMFANRISYWLNIKGPSISLSNACCSSTAALELAYQAIIRGECEAAIVGGGNICLHPYSSVHYGRVIKMSTDGKTRSFDSNASGCVKSDGVCVIFLQKAKDALRIYADLVHVKTAFSYRVEGDTSPQYGFCRNSSDVITFLKKFYEEAKVDPQAVQYVEAFGSAGPEADKVELDVIDEVFCRNRNNKVLVGSVMSNIGYGEAASGMNSITKVLLGYQNCKVAANISCDSPRQDVAALREGRIKIVTEHESFGRSYAAINNFSITGVNAHVLLNSHFKSKDLTRYKSTIPHLVLLSGRQDSAVRAIFDDLKTRPIDPEEIALFHNIHETNISGHLGRGFIILDTSKENKTVSLTEVVNYFDEAPRPLWFVYSGMGSQWAGMGIDLMRIPIFAASIERSRKVLEPKGIDIVHIITSTDKEIFDNILHSFVGIAAIQIGLTDLLRELGIYPDKIIGHSVGELGCAYADGCFTAEEMLLSAYSRGLVSIETPVIKGCMAAVGLGYQKISKLCPPEIEVACHNSSESSTISGPAGIMQEFITSLTKQKIFAKEVACSNIAYHSRYIAGAGPISMKYLNEVIKFPKLRSERWVSTSVPQERWNETSAKYSSAEYHTNNILNPVLFEEASKLIPSNAIVIEIAPHGLLQAILKRSLPECRHIPLTRRGHPDNARFLIEAVGKLYMEGCLPKVKALYPKIEYPVSTGTPMLSHLIKWAYDEKWKNPLYLNASVKTAAARTYVISIHDDEHNYLGGHIIRGKNRYPFAATLVCVWDTLAMTLGVEPKKLSVQFREVHLLSQPILHDKRSLRLSVTLLRGTGHFEVRNDIITVAKGYIFAEISPVAFDIGSSKADRKSECLNSDEIYQLLSSRDYGYEGAFRSIYSANFTQTDAKIIWQNNWVTLIDGILQLNCMRRTHNTVSQPYYIRQITINIEKHEATNIYKINNLALMQANIIDAYDSTSCGGILMENIQIFEFPSVYPTNKYITDIHGGEYYVPLDETSISGAEIILKARRIADVRSLHWVEAPEATGPGLNVKVHYAGINIISANRLIFLSELNKKHNCPCIEVDFSGTTKSGVRVMGVTQTETIASSLKAHTDLVWPVPASWSLEDAATVPLAYSMAFYILCIKSQLLPGYRVLVHGGAGALGQAIISIALAHGCEVFATVSNINKKRFLKKLFPELKDDHIGNSEDLNFYGMVFTATKGLCCDIVITCSTGELKKSYLNCCGSSGAIFDTGILHKLEDRHFNMYCLSNDRSHVMVDFSLVFKPQYAEEIKRLQILMSEGIARGYVRPLTRVIFKPQETSRAFRLLANRGGNGRVLLDLNQAAIPVLPRLICTPQSFQVLLSDNDMFGINLAEKLISRGAKKLILHLPNESKLLVLKLKLWQEKGITAKIFSSNISDKIDIVNILTSDELDGPIESIFVIITKLSSADVIISLKAYSAKLQNLDTMPKFFAVIKSSNNIEALRTTPITMDQGLTYINLPPITKVNEKEGLKSISINSAVDILERSLFVKQPVMIVHSVTAVCNSLLQEIATVADISLPKNNDLCITLKQLQMDLSKASAIHAYLCKVYNIYIPEDHILTLTLQEIADLEKHILDKNFKDSKGLKTFYSHLNLDELMATTEIVFLPTLINNRCYRDEEFDSNLTYLCIVPGLEGFHLRFQELCERLKLPALVLQPGLNNLHENIQDLAARFTSSLLSKKKIKNKFYLLGYECGVFVALEMAKILEKHGLTGTVYCLGGSPDLIKAYVDYNLLEFETDTDLQLGVVKHMYSLMVNDDTEELDAVLQSANTWNDKVKACVRIIRGRLPCSNQYATELIQAAYYRILQVRQYHPQPHKLRSLLVSIIPQHSFDIKSLSSNLSQFTQQSVISYQLETPLAFVAQDLRCAAIVNRHLDSDLIDSYNERNLCDTYLVNSNSDISLTTEIKDM